MAMIQQSPAAWPSSSSSAAAAFHSVFGRMSSVEELDSSLTLLSRHHAVLSATGSSKIPTMTPPTTPMMLSRLARRNTDDENSEPRFDYTPESPSTARIPPNTPVSPSLNLVLPPCTSTTNSVATGADATQNAIASPLCNGTQAASSVAAIDNKIEQAMDLVKSHLTFAVREEVELLRQTILGLEQRMHHLEDENKVLRKYAPKEVVSNLGSLIAQQKAMSSKAIVPDALQAQVPAAFCANAFATSLAATQVK